MNIFIIIIEQGYMSIKYKKAYDWLEEDDPRMRRNDLDHDRVLPAEINIKSGNQ